jgi:hypothetical protein
MGRAVDSPLLLTETYSHAADGIRDGIAEYTNNYGDPAVWSARLPVLARD